MCFQSEAAQSFNNVFIKASAVNRTRWALIKKKIFFERYLSLTCYREQNRKFISETSNGDSMLSDREVKKYATVYGNLSNDRISKIKGDRWRVAVAAVGGARHVCCSDLSQI